MAPLALVANLTTRWRHLHCLQSWPPGCVTCIATLPWIALLALSVSIGLVSSSARVTSVKSAKHLLDGATCIGQRSDPMVYLGPIKSHTLNMIWKGVWPMLINLMFDHSRPRKSSILHVIALIKYLLEPIANCSPNYTWEYQCSMLTIVPMAKEKTRILLFPQLKILFLSEEINQHIFDLINQMRWPFSLSVLLLWEIGLIVFQDYSMLFYKFSWF